MYILAIFLLKNQNDNKVNVLISRHDAIIEWNVSSLF